MKMKRAALRVVQERREKLLQEEAQATSAWSDIYNKHNTYREAFKVMENNLDTNSTPIGQGATATPAEPKTLDEVKALDRSWFGKNPNREHRLRKAYACELVNRSVNPHPERIQATLLWTDDTGEFMESVAWLANPNLFANGEPSENRTTIGICAAR
jgi:hypothetical protein